MARRIKVRTKRPWFGDSDKKTLLIQKRALEAQVTRLIENAESKELQLRAYRRALRDLTGAEKPSPEYYRPEPVPDHLRGISTRQIRANRLQEQLQDVQVVVNHGARLVELRDRDGEVLCHTEYDNTPRVIRNAEGEQIDIQELERIGGRMMTDVEMAQMRRRDLFWEKAKIAGIVAVAVGLSTSLFWFDAQAIYEWFQSW